MEVTILSTDRLHQFIHRAWCQSCSQYSVIQVPVQVPVLECQVPVPVPMSQVQVQVPVLRFQVPVPVPLYL